MSQTLLNEFFVDFFSTRVFFVVELTEHKILNLIPGSLLLALEERQETDVGHFDDLESNARDVTDGMSTSSESGDEHLVVLFDVVQTAVIRNERSNTLTVFDELHADALSDGRVGLFRLDANLLHHDALGVRAASERVGLQRRSQVCLLVVQVGPSLDSTIVAQLASASDTAWLVSHGSTASVSST